MTKQLPLPPICVECGSPDLKLAKRDISFIKSNPGTIVSPNRLCAECQNCGEQYIGEKELLRKFVIKKK